MVESIGNDGPVSIQGSNSVLDGLNLYLEFVYRKFRVQLPAGQLFAAGSLEGQVDNSWFLPIESFNEAHHVLKRMVFI